MLDLDPLNENNHRRMISLKAYLGHVEEAFQQYEILSNILQNELGKEPSVETLRLINRIRDGNFNQDDISLFYTTK
jgi:DNA-binding SARP family transcriptional activator